MELNRIQRIDQISEYMNVALPKIQKQLSNSKEAVYDFYGINLDISYKDTFLEDPYLDPITNSWTQNKTLLFSVSESDLDLFLKLSIEDFTNQLLILLP